MVPDDGSSRGGYKWSNSEYRLKAETKVIPNRLDVDGERKKQVMDDSTIFLSNELERQLPLTKMNWGVKTKDIHLNVICIQTVLKQNVINWTFVFLKSNRDVLVRGIRTHTVHFPEAWYYFMIDNT